MRFLSLAALLYRNVKASCHALRDMVSALVANFTVLSTKFKVVAPLCVVPSSCTMMGVCGEDMVAPELAIPVPEGRSGSRVGVSCQRIS